MKNTHSVTRFLGAALCAALLCSAALAQQKGIVIEDWYSDVKTTLANHYTGKSVRAKLPIPDSRRGLEVVDGAIRSDPSKAPPPAAQAGEELIIKEVDFDDNTIRFAFAKNEPPPKRSFSNPLALPTRPKVSLRFTRELTNKDLTIENINRLLASAIDIDALQAANSPAVSSAVAAVKAAALKGSNAENIPMPEVVRDLGPADVAIGELLIESPVQGARVYIDGAYSGLAPRTLRLRAGLHTILVVGDGFAPWEQRLFIPGRKSSIIRAALEKD